MALATVNARPLPRTDETSIIKESATGVGGGAVFREYNISARLARKKKLNEPFEVEKGEKIEISLFLPLLTKESVCILCPFSKNC